MNAEQQDQELAREGLAFHAANRVFESARAKTIAQSVQTIHQHFSALNVDTEITLGLHSNWRQPEVVQAALPRLTNALAKAHKRLTEPRSHEHIRLTIEEFFRLSAIEPSFAPLADEWIKALLNFAFMSRPAVNIFIIEPLNKVVYVTDQTRHSAPNYDTAARHLKAHNIEPVHEVISGPLHPSANYAAELAELID